MILLDTVSTEVFQILRSRNYTVKMYDDDGQRVTEPTECRRFFAEPEGILVAIGDNGDNSKIRMIIGETDIGKIQGLLDTLRTAATKYNMIFNVTRRGHAITPADFATKTSVNEQREENMMILEGMYGTTRSSYLKMENARMIVRHSKKIDETILGSRGRNIEQIFVENAQGERFLFPTSNLAGGRAMTQHVNHGGSFADQVGSQIIRIAQDFSNLNAASGYMAQNAGTLSESVSEIREACKTRMREMRECFKRLSRSSGYPAEAKRLEEQANMLNEGDEADFTPHINSLRSTLMVEGHELDEGILKTIAEALKECGVETLKETGNETVKVFGRIINKEAWDDLVSGTIQFIQPPHMTDRPGFKTKDAELRFKLGVLVPQVRDDSLMTFLSFVADQLDNPDVNAMDMKNYRRVAMAAIAAAGLNESLATKSQPIREFDEWLRDFDAATVLAPKTLSEDEDDAEMDEEDGDESVMEGKFRDMAIGAAAAGGLVAAGAPIAKNAYDYHRGGGNNPAVSYQDAKDTNAWNDTVKASKKLSEWTPGNDDPDSINYGADDEAAEQAVEDVVNHFSFDDFIKHAGDELFWDNGDKRSPEESTHKREHIIDLLKSYISMKADVDCDCSSEAESLYDEVADKLTHAGYKLTEALSKEDVLIPTNQGDDLKREISAPTDEDPQTGEEVPADAAQVDRLRTLAGVNRP